MKTLPVYLNYVKKNDLAHICVGIEPETLCGLDSIISVVQVEDPEEDSTTEVCEECIEKFSHAIEYINIEPVIECDRCSYNYSSYESRSVDSMVENKVPVCKPCYEDLVENDDSGVYTSYKDSDPWRENTCDRVFEVPNELSAKFEKIESNQ